MANSDVRVWAVKGAEQRLLEIAEEAKAIFATFPELRGQGRGFIAGRRAESTNGRDQATVQKPSRRKRRTMSADARKRIGDAQRARWAKQKEASHRETGDSAAPSRGGGSRKKR